MWAIRSISPLERGRKEMREISRSSLSSLRSPLLFASILLQLDLAFSEDAKTSSSGGNAKASTHTGTKVILVLLGIAAVIAFAFFLFKLWQKKKRDEQYARLLKLFEEDDELEVELGLRD